LAKKLQKMDSDTMKKITPVWDVAVRSAPKHQTMSTSFLLYTSAGTLTGLSYDTSVPAAVKRQLCTGTQVHKYHDYATVEQVNRKMSNGKSDETHDWVRRMAGY
jgi:hypothetical protein